MYSLDQTQQIEAPLDEVFAFFSDPGNLARITPSWLSFRIHGPAPSALGEGSRIEYRIRWGLFTLRWVTRIARWHPPSDFQDAQEAGPYRVWLHTHRFSQRGSSVIMEDHVDYALPFGVLGRIAHRLRVRAQLEEIFDYRRRAIAEIFGDRPERAVAR
jgi:ligand-binding SRPBCC domain-containing protein